MVKRRKGQVKGLWSFLDKHPWVAVIFMLVIGFILTFKFSCDKTGIKVEKDSVEIPTFQKSK
jgi:hypothetical protein